MTDLLGGLALGFLLTYGLGVLAILIGALVVGLCWTAGRWVLGPLLEHARALAVPLLACATQNRHGLLSRRNAGRTGLPSAGRGVQDWTPTPALEATPTPREYLSRCMAFTSSCPRGDWHIGGVHDLDEAERLLLAHVDAEHGGQL